MTYTERLKQLDAARWRIAIALTAAMMVLYFGFILLVAYAKPLLGSARRSRPEPRHSPRRARHRRGVGAHLDLRALGQQALRRGDRGAPGAGSDGALLLHLHRACRSASRTWPRAGRAAPQHFYTAGGSVTGLQNGLALAGDYMSAASFLGIAGLVALSGSTA